MSTILIVDDDPQNCLPLADLLRDSGHDATCAPGAAEAMAFLRDRRPDLVMLGVLMPGMTGMELLRMFRAAEQLKDLPVVMWSALGDQHALAESEQLGALDYFVKSRVEWPQLRQRLEVHLARERAHQT